VSLYQSTCQHAAIVGVIFFGICDSITNKVYKMSTMLYYIVCIWFVFVGFLQTSIISQ